MLLVFESSDPVGSSANIIDGSFASARAMATLWRSPPDNLFGFMSALSLRPTSSSSFSALDLISFDDIFCVNIGISMFSTTEMFGIRLCSWKMNPMLSALNSFSFLEDFKSWPATVMEPESGTSSAPSMFNNVDFPEPDGPIIDTNSPSAIVRFIPFNALIFPSS